MFLHQQYSTVVFSDTAVFLFCLIFNCFFLFQLFSMIFLPNLHTVNFVMCEYQCTDLINIDSYLCMCVYTPEQRKTFLMIESCNCGISEMAVATFSLYFVF